MNNRELKGTILRNPPDEFDAYFTCLDFPERRETSLGPLGLEFPPLSAKVVEIPWPTCIYPMSKEETFDSHDPKQLHLSCV